MKTIKSDAMRDGQSGVTLETAVRWICKEQNLDFDDILDVKVNHPTDPTEITIIFGHAEPYKVDIIRPTN